MTKIEKIFGRKLPLSLLYQRSTIAQLSEILHGQGWSVPSSCSLLVTINPLGNKPPFFWIQGQDALPFMKRSLTADQPLYYLLSPLEIHENILIDNSIEKLAADYLKQIRQVQASGPYFIGGFSFGGLLAFEIARQLEEQGNKVGLLFLLCPSLPGDLVLLIRKPVAWHREKLKQLGSHEKLIYVMSSMKRLLMKLTFKALEKTGRIHAKIFRSMVCRSAINVYRPGIICSDRTVLIQSRDVSGEDHFDWRNVIIGRLEVHPIDVNHLELLKRPHMLAWVACLQKYLQEAQAIPSVDKQ